MGVFENSFPRKQKTGPEIDGFKAGSLLTYAVLFGNRKRGKNKAAAGLFYTQAFLCKPQIVGEFLSGPCPAILTGPQRYRDTLPV